MIQKKPPEIEEKAENGLFLGSKRIYLEGSRPDVRVPMREITLSPTQSSHGSLRENAPVRVYDTSGPWGAPDFHRDCRRGLPLVRESWVKERGDLEECEGREVRPEDDGYLSEALADRVARSDDKGRLERFESGRRTILRAKPGQTATQLHYARQGIVTPEMEFVAIRENMKLQRMAEDLEMSSETFRNELNHQHPGESFGASIPRRLRLNSFGRKSLAVVPSYRPT